MNAKLARTWAGRLIDEFGSIASTLAADVETVTDILDGNSTPAIHLRQFRSVMLHSAQSQLKAGSVFQCHSQMIDFLRLEMAHLRVEQMRALFLDRRYSLISNDVLAVGTINEVQCYPRQVARRAVVLDAAGVILVHNHPSGDPKMSGADKSMTYAVDEACRAIGVRLHDHLVICRETYSSFRQSNPLWARVA